MTVAHPPRSPFASGWYAVAVLALVYMFATIDRTILTTLVEPIQRDLRINDTEVGLLHGLAFTLFYATFAIPIASVADRVNRKRLIMVCIVAWSIATVCCGLARSFLQLFAIRICVGIGEAGLSPAAYSLFGDYFPARRRAMAASLFQIGAYLGMGTAILTGGILLDHVQHAPPVSLGALGPFAAWQVVFFFVGLPGLVAAMLVGTVREPERTRPPSTAATVAGFVPQLARALAHMRAHLATYVLHFLGFSLAGASLQIALLWGRPYLTRTFGLPPVEASTIMGVLVLVFGPAGAVCGGLISGRLQRRGQVDAPIVVGLVATVGMLLAGGALALGQQQVGIVALAAVLFCSSAPFGPATAALQRITPHAMHALVIAGYLLVFGLINGAGATAAVGLCTDYLFASKSLLGAAVAVVNTGCCLLAIVALALLRRPYVRTAQAAPPAAGGRDGAVDIAAEPAGAPS